MFFCFSEATSDSMSTMKLVTCGESIINTTYGTTSKFYLFKQTIPTNVISIELALTSDVARDILMAYPLLHIRSINWTIIQSTNQYMLLKSLQPDTYILEVTETVTPGKFKFHISCSDTSAPTQTPSHSPTTITINPSSVPTPGPTDPKYQAHVPTFSPSTAPTITNFQGHVNCGDTISGNLSRKDNMHWYGLDVKPPGWNTIKVQLCVPNINISFAIYDENNLPYITKYNAAVRDEGVFRGSQNPEDCNDEWILIYSNRLELSLRSLLAGKYMILVNITDHKDNQLEDPNKDYKKYELRVSCDIPADTEEILRDLPLSSWEWSDAFDHEICRNPANLFWCAEYSYDSASYVQADLEDTFIIYAVHIWQANYWSYYYHRGQQQVVDIPWTNEWVETCNLQYSLDGETFKEYQHNPVESSGDEQQLLDPPITAKFLRFIPVDFHNAKFMTIRATGKS